MTRSPESAIGSKPNFALYNGLVRTLIHFRGVGAAPGIGMAANRLLDRYADLL